MQQSLLLSETFWYAMRYRTQLKQQKVPEPQAVSADSSALQCVSHRFSANMCKYVTKLYAQVKHAKNSLGVEIKSFIAY